MTALTQAATSRGRLTNRLQTLVACLARPRTADAERRVTAVVTVHGRGTNGSTLAAMVDPLLRAGIAVVPYDAASQGDGSCQAFSTLLRFAEEAQDGAVPLSDAHRLHATLRRGDLLIVEGDHDLRPSLQPHSDELVRFSGTHLQALAA